MKPDLRIWEASRLVTISYARDGEVGLVHYRFRVPVAFDSVPRSWLTPKAVA